MNKVIMAGSFDFGGVPVMQLAKVHSRGMDKDFMTKRAAVLTKEIAEIRPEPGRSIIHVIALGDTETYGMNRNGDIFPKVANVERHHTFVTDAHVFSHHKNKDKRTADGQVKASAYNPEMHRVDLLIAVDDNKWRDSLEKLAHDEMIPVSMACRVPYDECTGCHHKAKTRDEYCECLRDHMTKLSADGTQIGAINRYPTFFDISRVHRNADRIAFGLEKVAAAHVVSGAELAEELGLALPFTEEVSGQALKKMSVLKRMAEIEKELPGVAAGSLRNILPAAHIRRITEKEAAELHRVDPKILFDTLAKEAVCLSIEDFYKVIYGDKFPSIEETVKKAQACLPGVFGRLLSEGEKVAADGAYDPKPGPISLRIKDLVCKLAQDMSLREGPSMTRIASVIIRKEQPPVGVFTVTAQVKEASEEATFLASEYAKYELAFAANACRDENDGILVLTSLQNYVK